MQESRQMALKQTEDQVKQMRDDPSVHAHTRNISVRSKIASKVSGKAPKERMQSMGLSDQDIKAALGLVDESWARQEYRLEQYLQRNYNLANGIPTTMVPQSLRRICNSGALPKRPIARRQHHQRRILRCHFPQDFQHGNRLGYLGDNITNTNVHQEYIGVVLVPG
jgi:hypothetical protein